MTLISGITMQRRHLKLYKNIRCKYLIYLDIHPRADCVGFVKIMIMYKHARAHTYIYTHTYICTIYIQAHAYIYTHMCEYMGKNITQNIYLDTSEYI